MFRLKFCLLIVFIYDIYAQDFPNNFDPQAVNPYINEQQQYNPYLNPQLGGYYPNQPLPIQPQFYYPGSPGAHAGGQQPFLFNNGAPPNNFLIPQAPFDPNTIYRNQNPLFIAGYPKPAHVPAIDKDAEEVPTDPKKGPAVGKKPEKIEFDENEPAYVPQKPLNNRPNNYPGQRFFILNGQQLFPHINPGPERFNLGSLGKIQANPTPEQFNIPQRFNFNPLQQQPLQQPKFNPGQLDDGQTIPGAYLKDLLPLRLQNQVVNNDNLPQDVVLKSLQDRDVLQSRYSDKGLQLPLEHFNYYRLPVDNDNNDAVVVDAKYQQDDDSESIEGITEKPAESSVAQAQPGAIALAGVGGVAAAGPRGTALAGEGGLAVSSPHATAVAGPSRDGEVNDNKKLKSSKVKTKTN